MKKNLRSKILLCVLAGGVLAANTALASTEYPEKINGAEDKYADEEIRTDDRNGNYTYTFNDGYNVNVSSDTATYPQNPVSGISDGNPDVNSITINGKINLTVNAKAAQQAYAYGVHNSKYTILDDISIIAEANADGNDAVNVKSEGIYSTGIDSIIETGKVNINSTATGNASSNVKAYGVHSWYYSRIEIDGGNIESSVKTEGGTAYSIGVYAETGTIKIDDNSHITAKIDSKENASAFVYGIATESYGTVNLGNNVNIVVEDIGDSKGIDKLIGINADTGKVNMVGGSVSVNAVNGSENTNTDIYAVYALNNAEVNFNKDTQNDMNITGDIGTSGSATVNLTLNTIKSKLNGAIDDNSTNGTNLTLANGAAWNNTGTSNVKNVNMNSGIINQNAKEDITVNNYSGSGDINFAAEDTDNNGVLNFANTGVVTIESAEAGSYVNLGVINNTINTLDSEKAEANLNAIAQKLTYKGNNLSGKVTVKEGLITPEASGDLLFYEDAADGHTVGQGYVTNVTQGNGGSGSTETATMTGMKNIAATAIVAWRQEDSTLSQRLGELRESDGGQGIWVRMSRGEFEYDGEYKNQYNFFQMGYDWAAGSWHYGAAISHNDGQTTYTHGDGENRSTSLSLYGTWLGDKGHYADIVLKQGRLSNDFDIYTEAGHTSGDYDAWGTSLSGEYGMKVDLDGGWYVTPQAQLTLMRIGGEDYTTNNGIKVNQDSLESAVGRVGFEVGKRISDSGSIYAKASLLHDFAGSADTYLSHKGLTNSYHQDIGDTWCEAGIGFNYKTSENSYVYADVVKTFGGDVETPWQWNAGMRWTF
ncbi:MAG TPA: autotransporter outer membrane beta-barrel domain-containing protein [Candidatus Fusicatenibacter intestinipullorum]|nr:autotransporter outer membrane beta-barrel domain-containing protein [Candidatus Fusicatenibacter intestinipullorum]